MQNIAPVKQFIVDRILDGVYIELIDNAETDGKNMTIRNRKTDERADIIRMDTNFYRARDCGKTVAQYVMASINVVHIRRMACGRDKGRPIHEMTAAIY